MTTAEKRRPQDGLAPPEGLAAPVRDELRRLGLQREEWRLRRGEDAEAERERIRGCIREAHDDAREIGIYVDEIAELLGVSRQGLHLILKGTTARPRAYQRTALLVALTAAQRDALLAAIDDSDNPHLDEAIRALRDAREVTWQTARQAGAQREVKR